MMVCGLKGQLVYSSSEINLPVSGFGYTSCHTLLTQHMLMYTQHCDQRPGQQLLSGKVLKSLDQGGGKVDHLRASLVV